MYPFILEIFMHNVIGEALTLCIYPIKYLNEAFFII